MKHFWLIALFASVATPALAQQYQYVARTEAPAARQGAVTAGALNWQCQGNVCTISGPWAAPGTGACAQLAREVGRIVAYGRQGNMLGAAALTTCNAGVLAAAPTLRVPPIDVTRGPLITIPPLTTPSRSIAFTTPELSFVASADSAPLPGAAVVGFTTPELSFVASAEAAASAPPETVSFTTPALSFVVR